MKLLPKFIKTKRDALEWAWLGFLVLALVLLPATLIQLNKLEQGLDR